MRSVVALWGYRLPGETPAGWGGDVSVETVSELLDPLRWP
jgi:phosphoglycolate phosphatase